MDSLSHSNVSFFSDVTRRLRPRLKIFDKEIVIKKKKNSEVNITFH